MGGGDDNLGNVLTRNVAGFGSVLGCWCAGDDPRARVGWGGGAVDVEDAADQPGDELNDPDRGERPQRGVHHRDGRRVMTGEGERGEGEADEDEEGLEFGRSERGEGELACDLGLDVGEDGGGVDAEDEDEREVEAIERDGEADHPIGKREWVGEVVEKFSAVAALVGRACVCAVDHVGDVVGRDACGGEEASPPVCDGAREAEGAEDGRGVADGDDGFGREPARRADELVEPGHEREEEGVEEAVRDAAGHGAEQCIGLCAVRMKTPGVVGRAASIFWNCLGGIRSRRWRIWRRRGGGLRRLPGRCGLRRARARRSSSRGTWSRRDRGRLWSGAWGGRCRT